MDGQGYVRCQCGKIVAEVVGKLVLIKCRHCKRYVMIDLTKQEADVGSEDRVPTVAR